MTMLSGRRQGLEAFDFAGARNEVGAVNAWLGRQREAKRTKAAE